MEKEKINELKESIRAVIDKNKNFYHVDLVEQTENLWVILFQINSVVKHVYESLDINRISEKQKCCLYILTNCISDIIHSFECLKNGSIKGSSSLLRCVVENISLAVAIHSDETDENFEKYKANTLNITRMISISKSHFGEIGSLYGILSNNLVHEPYDMIFRLLQKKPDIGVSINTIKEIEESNLTELLLLIYKTGMVSVTLGRVLEWTFAKSIVPKIFYDITEQEFLKQKDSESIGKLNLIEICLKKYTCLD